MRTLRAAGAVVLTTVLCLGVSAGPATADDAGPGGQEITAPADPGTSTPPTSTAPPATTGTSSAAPSQSATPPREDPEGSTSPAPGTSSPAPKEELPDLTLTAWFDKPSYLGHEEITARVRVTNVGGASVNQAMVTSTGPFSTHDWVPFFPAGWRVEPGQSVEGSLTGRVTGTVGVLRLVITVRPLGDEQDANPADNETTVSVPIMFVQGGFRGLVYGDTDGDKAVDPGEELQGITVRASDDHGGHQTTTTGPDGRFTFLGLPGGTYWIRVESPGWYFTRLSAVVDGTDDPDVVLRGVREIGRDALTASMSFTQQDYRVNDIARLLVTLTNGSAATFTDLTASCTVDGVAEFDAGELARGAVLPAATTKTFEMTMRITSEARTQGHVRADCRIGAPPSSNGYAQTTAFARVPGGMASRVVGHVAVFRYKPLLGLPSGVALPGVKVYLTDRVTGEIVARDVTTVEGRFEFRQTPAGIYRFGIVGPWRFVYSDPDNFVVQDGENGDNTPWWEWYHRRTFFVLPGPDQPDPDLATPARPAPPGADTGTPPLAVTGAGVTWLALGGLLSLLAGSALVLAGGRRPDPR
ncbi:carboxypeptidase regulatory-like domain-containing protein [Lentzea sp. NPDC055074]